MVSPQGSSEVPTDGSTSSRSLQRLHRRVYGFRMLGMGLGGLPVLAVLYEIEASWWAWGWACFGCFVWPHLAFQIAHRSRDPGRAELRNLVGDSFFAGTCAPLMHFNVLPSVVLISVVMADKLNSGIRGLLPRALPFMALGLAGVGWLQGFAWRPESSLTVVLASLPILVIHTLAVAHNSYRLLRKVQQQNLQLEKLSRVDALTGLSNRGYWEQSMQTLLRDRDSKSGPGWTLGIIDLNAFKTINDVYGHTAGDDVLRGVAEVLQSIAGARGIAGRLGGDEFALVLPGGRDDTLPHWHRLRESVSALRFEGRPGLRASVSLGYAELGEGIADLRAWLDAADREMYRDKHGERLSDVHALQSRLRR